MADGHDDKKNFSYKINRYTTSCINEVLFILFLGKSANLLKHYTYSLCFVVCGCITSYILVDEYTLNCKLWRWSFSTPSLSKTCFPSRWNELGSNWSKQAFILNPVRYNASSSAKISSFKYLWKMFLASFGSQISFAN